MLNYSLIFFYEILRHWFFWRIFMGTSETTPQLVRETFIATFTDRLLVAFIKLRLQIEFHVAHGTRKVIDAPSFVQSSEHWNWPKIRLNHTFTNIEWPLKTENERVVTFSMSSVFRWPSYKISDNSIHLIYGMYIIENNDLTISDDDLVAYKT